MIQYQFFLCHCTWKYTDTILVVEAQLRSPWGCASAQRTRLGTKEKQKLFVFSKEKNNFPSKASVFS